MSKYYIVFSSQVDSGHWVQRFLKVGFKHCYYLKIQDKNTVHLINPSLRGLFINSYIGIDAECFLKALKTKGELVCKVKDYEPEQEKAVGFSVLNMLPTCVNVIKTFLNLKTFAQTPYGLYKWLRKINRIEVL